MSAITYGLGRVPAGKAASHEKGVEQRKNLFVRFMDALAESRLQQAHREIVKHAHLLPRDKRSEV